MQWASVGLAERGSVLRVSVVRAGGGEANLAILSHETYRDALEAKGLSCTQSDPPHSQPSLLVRVTAVSESRHSLPPSDGCESQPSLLKRVTFLTQARHSASHGVTGVSHSRHFR